MMRGISQIIKKTICTLTAAFMITSFMPVTGNVFAQTSESSLELDSIISRYEGSQVQVKSGLILQPGESVSISEIIGGDYEGELSPEVMDSNIAYINGNDVVGDKPGSTYVVIEVDGQVFISGIEVMVPMSTYDISVNNIEEKALKTRYTVFIDAGHGGKDPGAIGNGLREKDLTLDIAKRVEAILKGNNIDVIMTRNDDTHTDYKKISGILNSTDADIFTSIHINSNVGTPATGIETFHTRTAYLSEDIKMESKELAEKVQSNLISKTSAQSRGVKESNFSVISNTKVPAVLTECGFINNPTDATKLGTTFYRQLLAQGISDGIMEYLKENVTLSSINGERIYGSTRYETSYSLAKMGWSNSDTVVIASGEDYPDTLCASPLATKNGAPILLARNQSLSSQGDLNQLISSLKVKKAYIVGGTTALNQGFESELRNKGIQVVRLGGKDRYETSAIIAKELGTVSEAFFASGLSFPDSISVSSIASKKGVPILLTRASIIPEAISSYMKTQSFKNTYVVGGTTVVSDAVVQLIPNSQRIAGRDRYTTNEAVFNKFKSEINMNDVYVATGSVFPDALSVSALAGKNGNFVIISDPNYIMGSANNIISSNSKNINKVYVLGGPTLISDQIMSKIGVSVK